MSSIKNHRLPSAAVAALVFSLVCSSLWAQIPEDHFFDSDGVQLRYTVQGAGEPVLLLHGYGVGIDMNWRGNGVIDRLAQEFQVIAMDARGHGRSGKPHDPAAYGNKMVDDIVRLLDHLEIERAHIVGYSMGGFLTLKLLTQHPERFLFAVLGGAGMPDSALAASTEELAASLESGNGIEPLLRALAPPGQPPQTDEQITMINSMMMAMNDPLALAAVARGLPEIADIDPSAVGSLEVPILAIVGELDPLRAGVDNLAELLPGLRVRILAGRDHMTAMNDPMLVESVRDFYVELCKCA